ncbi:helix-turn-helix domain-containing protein [Leucobacter ruminantium]
MMDASCHSTAHGVSEPISLQHEAASWRDHADRRGTAQWMEAVRMIQRRRVTYGWHLRERMTEHGITTARALLPLLAERGVHLSVAQVHRTITTPPVRLSLRLLAALCDIFDVKPDDLIATSAEAVVRPVARQEKLVPVPGEGMRRPIRARVHRP